MHYNSNSTSQESGLSKIRDACRNGNGIKDCLKSTDNVNYMVAESNSKVFNRTKIKVPEVESSINMSQNRRGFQHTFEIGNFSNYNSVLKRNQDAMLNR